jgi:hypothetical protein
MADIIEFKSKIKKEDTGLIDNSDLVDTRHLDPSSREFGYINGKKVMKPRTQYEYLMLCKQFLTVEDYMDLCCGIMDHDWCMNIMDEKLKSIVDCYYTYKV